MFLEKSRYKRKIFFFGSPFGAFTVFEVEMGESNFQNIFYKNIKVRDCRKALRVGRNKQYHQTMQQNLFSKSVNVICNYYKYYGTFKSGIWMLLMISVWINTGCRKTDGNQLITTFKKTFGQGMGWQSQQTTDGGYITSGNTFETNVNDTTVTQADLKLIKTDIYGNLIWEKTLNSQGIQFSGFCLQTNDGGYITSSVSFSKPSKFLNNGGTLIIYKVDAYGNNVWSKNFTSLYGGGFMNETADKSYIVNGLTNSLNQINIIKLLHNGNIIYNKTFPKPVGYGQLRPTNDGNFIIAGNVEDSSSKLYILKCDTNGVQVWKKVIETGKQLNYLMQIVSSITQTKDGGFLITREEFSFLSPNHYNYHNSLVIKTDAFANVVWSKNLGTGVAGLISSVFQISDEGYILARLILDNKTHLFKIDKHGQQIWQKTVEIAAKSVIQTIDNGYLITGTIRDTSTKQDKILLLKTDKDGNY